MSKINAKKILFIVFILLAVSILFSDIVVAADSDIINNIVKSFADKTEKWTDVAKKICKKSFLLVCCFRNCMAWSKSISWLC